MPELKADAVLQERLNSLPNVTVLKNVQTKEITGTDKVNGISYIDRETEEVHHVELQRCIRTNRSCSKHRLVRRNS